MSKRERGTERLFTRAGSKLKQFVLLESPVATNYDVALSVKLVK